MAIVSKLPVDAIIWKFVRKEKHYRMDPDRPYSYVRDERGGYIQDEVDVYYYVQLYTRRARTSGCSIDEKLVPFFEKLKIRIDKGYQGRGMPIAVGCTTRKCKDKEEWDNIELHEVVQKYYNKVKNMEILKIMQKEQKITPTKAIDDLKDIDLTLKDEPEEWPEEPHFYEQTPYWVTRGHF